MKKILIGADPYETRVAIVEDSQVVESYIERAERRSLLGNVYLGRVDNVLPGMEAAFVDVGLEKNGFLYVDEIVLPELDDKARRQKRIQELIRPRQELLVQVVKDPMGTKGARLTMELSFAGRFLVYAPEGTGYGVSKRLDEEERERLRELVKKLSPRDGGGLIVRTAARNAQLPELERDLRLLEELWDRIRASAKQGGAPRLVHQEVDLALEMVRDDLRIDVDEVITDDEPTYERIREYVEQHSPEMVDRVRLHNAAAPLLRRYEVERAIESTLHRRVDLPSGGYLLFDYAEAFTIIDVNTGRFVGKSRLEDTILANNLEAAREVVRQLRLRDIGGIIVIDFIDMATKKNRDAVIACLQDELKKDRSKVYLVSISPLGLVEMTRQNVTDGVREILSAKCPTCHGEGIVLSDESLAVDNLRTLRRHARLSTSEAFLIELDPRVAARMIGAGGRRLAELEESTGKHFSLVGVEGVPRERCSVVREGKVEEIMAEAIPVRSGEELEVEIGEPHMFQVADAVASLPGGYRIVVAGAGPYLRERHKVRVERAGRLGGLRRPAGRGAGDRGADAGDDRPPLRPAGAAADDDRPHRPRGAGPRAPHPQEDGPRRRRREEGRRDEAARGRRRERRGERRRRGRRRRRRRLRDHDDEAPPTARRARPQDRRRGRHVRRGRRGRRDRRGRRRRRRQPPSAAARRRRTARAPRSAASAGAGAAEASGTASRARAARPWARARRAPGRRPPPSPQPPAPRRARRTAPTAHPAAAAPAATERRAPAGRAACARAARARAARAGARAARPAPQGRALQAPVRRATSAGLGPVPLDEHVLGPLRVDEHRHAGALGQPLGHRGRHEAVHRRLVRLAAGGRRDAQLRHRHRAIAELHERLEGLDRRGRRAAALAQGLVHAAAAVAEVDGLARRRDLRVLEQLRDRGRHPAWRASRRGRRSPGSPRGRPATRSRRASRRRRS